MLQPFEIMKEIYLKRLIELKRYYLVCQSYKRASETFFDGAGKVSLLATDYADIGLAKGHLSALKCDSYACIIDLSRPGHLRKIISMTLPQSAYKVFWAVVRKKDQLEKRLTTKYKDNMKRYISRNTEWRVDRDKTIYPALQQIYGELFVTLKYGHETRRITFEELEKS